MLLLVIICVLGLIALSMESAGRGMVERVRVQVCVYVVLSLNPTSDQVTPGGIFLCGIKPHTKIEILGWGLCPVRSETHLAGQPIMAHHSESHNDRITLILLQELC